LDDEDMEWGVTTHGGAGGGAGGGFRGKLSTLDEESLGKVMQKWMLAPVNGDSLSSWRRKSGFAPGGFFVDAFVLLSLTKIRKHTNKYIYIHIYTYVYV
jgi:hypothetical protein